MPEEPTLAHVATTLQFCLEQLQLCEEVVVKANRLVPLHYIQKASMETAIALSVLHESGIEPASLRAQPEGAVPA